MLQTLRLISLPFLHCVWSSVAGYYIGLGLLQREKAAALAVVGLAAAAVLHRLYDCFAGSLLSLAVPALAVPVFLNLPAAKVGGF